MPGCTVDVNKANSVQCQACTVFSGLRHPLLLRSMTTQHCQHSGLLPPHCDFFQATSSTPDLVRLSVCSLHRAQLATGARVTVSARAAILLSQPPRSIPFARREWTLTPLRVSLLCCELLACSLAAPITSPPPLTSPLHQALFPLSIASPFPHCVPRPRHLACFGGSLLVG